MPVNRRPDRHRSPADAVISRFDKALRTLAGTARANRPNPGEAHPEADLTAAEKQLAGRLMRINHCGEVCAQALYMAQGLTSNDENTRQAMAKAAEEEIDHLVWCESRLAELGNHKSYLNPVFFGLSFAQGAAAGLLGNRFNLGFVAATEEQVMKHLDAHLSQISEKDQRSRAILKQMKTDEGQHRSTALNRGGEDFPAPVKSFMTSLSRLMTRTTYWV